MRVGIADHVSTRNPGMRISTPRAVEQYLSALECDVLQGFLFSKALPAAAFEELLMEQKRVTSNQPPMNANEHGSESFALTSG